MRDTATMVRVARGALQGGARGLRVNGLEDIAAIRAVTDVPIIGLFKELGQRRNVITVHTEQAQQLARAGADIVAVDATNEVFENIGAAIARFTDSLDVPVMADVSTLAEGLQAWDAGALFVGTTLSGYTPYSAGAGDGPDIELVEQLAARDVRVIAEGRYSSPEQVRRAFECGAFAVVVGGAITDPILITRRFSLASPRMRA
jgi:N-acylglucosamine-6-phosphate 2-epimerase